MEKYRIEILTEKRDSISDDIVVRYYPQRRLCGWLFWVSFHFCWHPFAGLGRFSYCYHTDEEGLIYFSRYEDAQEALQAYIDQRLAKKKYAMILREKIEYSYPFKNEK